MTQRIDGTSCPSISMYNLLYKCENRYITYINKEMIKYEKNIFSKSTNKSNCKF